MRRYESYKVKRGDNLGDPNYWNRRLEDLDIRLHLAELYGQTIDNAVDDLTAVALQRLDDTFTPLVEEALTKLETVGALFEAESLTELEMDLGELTFVITPQTRNAWVITDYLVISAIDAPGNGMVAQVVDYQRENGLLIVDVLAVIGTGTFEAWRMRVSAPPDLEHASRTDNPHLTTAVQVGAVPTTDIVNDLTTGGTTKVLSAEQGKTLKTQVDGKAAASHGHAVADITNLQTSLNAKSALTQVVRHDTSQSLSDTEKKQVLANLGSPVWSTGDVRSTLRTTAAPGWRLFDDGTIGSATSGATYQNADAQALFTLIFTVVSDANAPILTSAGSGTTRAAQTDAPTAWAANCRISLPKALGRLLGVAGAGSGLTSRALGVAVGAETETPTVAKTAAHDHSGIRFPGASINLTQDGSLISFANRTDTIGDGNALSILPPTVFLNAEIKL